MQQQQQQQGGLTELVGREVLKEDVALLAVPHPHFVLDFQALKEREEDSEDSAGDSAHTAGGY